MKIQLITTTVGALALIAAPGVLQALPQSSLRRVPPVEEEARLDRARWQPALTDEDLDAREAAYADLLDLARTQPAIRSTLEAWTEDEDALLAWTCRLALRELQALPAAPREPRDPFTDLFGGRSPFDDTFLRTDPQELFDQLRRQVEPHTPFRAPSLAPGLRSRSDGLSLQMGPDGVKVEIREQVDGEEKVRTYEADSLEALLETNPELEPQLGPYVEAPRNLSRPDFFGRRLRPSPRPLTPPGPVDPKVLGVLAETHPDGGLVIAQVMPNSIADDLGLKVDEVVVEINGREIRTHVDVRNALEAAEPGQDVVVTILDVTGKRRNLTWSAR